MITHLQKEREFFLLETPHTSYVIGILPTGQPEHLYYGRKIKVRDPMALAEKHAFGPGNTIAYNEQAQDCSLEDLCAECSGYGKGDIGEPFIELVDQRGSVTTDFVYDSCQISKGKPAYRTLPGSYDDNDDVEHLTLTLKDRNHDLRLELHYYVFADSDVIARSSKLINTGKETVRVERLMSLELGFRHDGNVITTFNGGWAREMHRNDTVLKAGKLVNSSFTGTSSSRANPFFMVSKPETVETYGDCYGFNLLYSGNHYEAAEVNSFHKTRIVTGMNPQGFRWILNGGEELEAPEAILTYSCEGYTGMSHNMHAFIRKHIVRGYWRDRVRPILLNSWEAFYFHFNEAKLLRLARTAKDAGIELFVLDDGWFGKRDDDTSSLGDWTVNLKKLPSGLKGLADKIHAMGMDFGIWVEPEMVNTDSDLYRAHPDWVMAVPDTEHAEGRHQRILDLANPEVVDHLIQQMKNVFASADINYVKWDMNRIFSDCYSPYLDPEHQGETAHRYVLGLYRMMKELTEAFPEILFEGCASGGNRFDAGILCYCPQIWGSDNTDALCRLEIQEGYSYGYPLSTVGAHVSSCPNHQTLRTTPIETRFAAASFGILGYECSFNDLSTEDMEAVKVQIALYKEWREVMQKGTFYRGGEGEDRYTWTVVSEDRKKAVGMTAQKLAQANQMYLEYHAPGLDPDQLYHFYGRELKYNIKAFGDLVNTVSPVHVKQNSLVHNLLARVVKMDGEKEDVMVYGDTLMYAGIKLKQAFAATGYNSEVRFYPDFASRMYFMEEQDETEKGE